MITITKQPNKTIENIFNNQVYEFTGDELKTSTRADWQIVKGTDNLRVGRITSNLNNFYVNLKNPVKNLCNLDNFSDTIQPTILSYIQTDNNLFHELQHQFTVTYNDGSSDVESFDKSYLKAVDRLFRPLEIENTTFKPLLNSNYINLWEGVPLDVCFYSDEIRDVVITNEQTLVNTTLTFQKGVNRLFLSLGTLQGFETAVPLLTGIINVLTFRTTSDTLLATIQVYKNGFCQSPYLKWFNSRGGWSYFQFDSVFTEDTSSIERGLLLNDTENVEDTISNFKTTGKESSLSQRFKTPSLNEDEKQNFIDLFTSPKVFFYNGIRNQNFELRNWKEVRVESSTVQTENTKLINKEFEVRISLPNIYTQQYG